MHYIIGLGNPGKEFEKTRHNVGYLVLDKVKKEYDFPDFQFNKKIDCLISKGKIEKISVALIKPCAFMNESGRSIRNLIKFYEALPHNIFIIHDDIDLFLGKNKMSYNAGSGGHNGVQDIIDKIKTKGFYRVRIGVANDKLRSQIDPADFVLQKFSFSELKKINQSALEMLNLLLEYLHKKIQD